MYLMLRSGRYSLDTVLYAAELKKDQCRLRLGWYSVKYENLGDA